MLNRQSIESARRYFIDLIDECIEEAQSHTIEVNDLDGYIADLQARKDDYQNGRYDHSLTFRQMATYYQTGEMRAILP